MKIALYVLLALGLAQTALAADEKIDPATYICAELIAVTATGEPPIYEALQLDGFAAGKSGQPVADPELPAAILESVLDSCSARPTETAISHWETARKSATPAQDGLWRADKSTCAQLLENMDDGSGFVIWLDGYNRSRTNTPRSILKDQAALDSFLAFCRSHPEALMQDAISQNAR